MPVIYGRVKLQESLGATATTFTEGIRFNYVLKNLITNLYMVKEEGCPSTIQDLVDKITQFRITTENGDPESTIDGDDLFDFPKYAMGIHPFASKLTDTDNIPHAVSILYPFTTFPDNFRAPYGLHPNHGVQMAYDTAADVDEDFDGGTTDILTEGVTTDIAGTNGYIKFTRHAYTTGAVDSTEPMQVIGNKLLGVYNLMATSFDDLAGGEAINTTGIREQQLTKSDNTVLRWKPFQSWATRPSNTLNNFDSVSGNEGDNTDILDDGRWFHNLGIRNIPAGIIINDDPNVEVKTTTGNASEATRVHGVILVTPNA